MIKDIDPHRVSLVLALLFVLGLGATAYSIYSIPADGKTQIWIYLAITSLLGGFSLVLALRTKKEILVYKERSNQSSENDSMSAGNSTDGSMDLSEIKQLVQKPGKELIVNGLKAICKQIEAGQGAYYLVKEQDDSRWVELIGGYALSLGENATIKFDMGEGLIGQSAAEGKTLYIDEVPEGYMKIASGLGMASPRYLLITPIKKEEKVTGVIEVSTFKALSDTQRKFVEEAAQLLSAKA